MKKYLSLFIKCIILLSIINSFNPVFANDYEIIIPVSATAKINNDKAKDTIDSNPDEFNSPTYWQAATDPPYGPGEEIVFDIGQTLKVEGFRETSGPFPANSFQASISNDGENYIQIYSGTLTKMDFGYHFFDLQQEFRFIKLFLNRTDLYGYGELADFRVLINKNTNIMLDIKPNGCPNPYNIKSEGVVGCNKIWYERTCICIIQKGSSTYIGIT